MKASPPGVTRALRLPSRAMAATYLHAGEVTREVDIYLMPALPYSGYLPLIGDRHSFAGQSSCFANNTTAPINASPERLKRRQGRRASFTAFATALVLLILLLRARSVVLVRSAIRWSPANGPRPTSRERWLHAIPLRDAPGAEQPTQRQREQQQHHEMPSIPRAEEPGQQRHRATTEAITATRWMPST